MKENKHPHFLARLLRFTSKVAPHELTACALSFLLVLLLMGSYYLLRPVRDGMASDWSDTEVSFLWTLNFFISTAAVALYGWAVTWIRFNLLVPSVYGFFALSFVLFYLGSAEGSPWMNKSFYIWVSIFSLFHLSIFWSFMSDLFNKEQASRLFPVIGAGASAGAMIGPGVPALFAGLIGPYKLVLFTAILLILAIPMTGILLRLKKTQLGNRGRQSELDESRIGGNPFAGFRDFFTNRFLMSIGAFLILYTAIGSIVYFQQKNLLEDYSLAERTRILGAVDWIVNSLTFPIAFFATGRIVKRCGMPFTLSSIPFAMAAGLLILAAAPILMVALALQVARRTGNYAVTRPAREMLFTLVDREERFKAKPVIDIVVYRGGDMVASWGFAALTQGLGLGLGPVAAVGAVIAALWGMVGIYLGNWFEKTNGKTL
jgi:ATP:ADP antiporter, AAA family